MQRIMQNSYCVCRPTIRKEPVEIRQKLLANANGNKTFLKTSEQEMRCEFTAMTLEPKRNLLQQGKGFP